MTTPFAGAGAVWRHPGSRGDQALMRGGFVALLNAQDGIEVVGEQAARMTHVLRLDVVVIDIACRSSTARPPPA